MSKRVLGGDNHDTGSFPDVVGRRRGKAGCDFVHIAIDDCTRLVYTEVLADERAPPRLRSFAALWRSSRATARPSNVPRDRPTSSVAVQEGKTPEKHTAPRRRHLANVAYRRLHTGDTVPAMNPT